MVQVVNEFVSKKIESTAILNQDNFCRYARQVERTPPEDDRREWSSLAGAADGAST
ncbi:MULTISPECIES: hypothetical protein [unclassified Bradyrhizobium]|uniref:hypothetical protein n=1 Tax=unclassified Bradyrhizobium TaxID=2631580 RepID=UPI0024E173C9|nr:MULTISPECIES: hypothetical protein [unclassified Bradyrhizobium]